jgi:hypothetical protein
MTAAPVVLLVAAFWLQGDRSGTALPAFAYRHQHIQEAYRSNGDCTRDVMRLDTEGNRPGKTIILYG